MPTNSSRRETLKLYRIRTRGTAFGCYILGYRNFSIEYSRFNDDGLDAGGLSSTGKTVAELGYKGPSPKKFLSDNNFPSDAEFIIADTFEPYDRTKHDLAALASSIWIVTGNTDIPNAVAAVNVVNRDITRVVSFADPVTEVLEFEVNPLNLNVTKKKLFQKLRTRGGWAFQHWGPDIGEIQLDGVTRNITPPPQSFFGPPDNNDRGPKNNHANFDLQIPSETNSPTLKAFRLLEKWYDEDQGEAAQRTGILLAMEYRGRIYVGHIGTFSYNEVGTRPFLLAYKLTFLVHYDSGALGDATFRAQSRVIRNQQTIAHIKAIKDSTVGGDNVSTG